MSAAPAAPPPLYKCPKGAVDLTGSTADRITDLSRLAERIFRANGGTLLETPVFERTDLLLGKYGEEAETKLIYRLADQGGEELALRYDLTVPFVRYVRENGIKKMRRYSIGKVYRRDQPNPGQGRLREFYQADFDILGGAQEGMMAEATLLAMGAEFFDAAQIPVTIVVNDVRNLRTLLTRVGIPAADVRRLTPVIDKLDKQTFETLVPEFVAASSILGAEPVLLVALRTALESTEPVDADSQADWARLVEGVDALGGARLVWSNSLARGLGYYTGFIWEMKGTSTTVSVAAGGRYDGLLGAPTCGISFGISRIAALVPAAAPPLLQSRSCLVTTVGTVTTADKLRIVRALRNPEYGFDGVVYDFTTVDRKLGKVLGSADTRFVAIVAEKEWAACRSVVVRDMLERTERSICLALAAGLGPGSGGDETRAYLMERMRSLVGPDRTLPISGSIWVSLPPDERSLFRTMWMASERADWNATLKARAEGECEVGSYAALGNGRIVGYFSDRDEAGEASSNAIETTIGNIGISVIRQRTGAV